MYPNSFLYALTFAAIAQVTGWLAFGAIRRPGYPGLPAFASLMLAMTVRAMAAFFEFLAPTLAGKLLAAKLGLLGLAAIGPLWLAFALQYTGRGHLLTRRNQVWLAVPSLITAALGLTNEAHSLVWMQVGLDPSGFPGLLVVRGLWGSLFALINYAYLLTGAVLYIVAFARASGAYRRQIAVMTAGALVPLAGNALTLAGIASLTRLDLSQISLPLAGAMFGLGLFRYGNPELTPVALRMVMDNLREAVIVLDASQRVIDLNPAARQLFSLGDEAIGRQALEVLRPREVWERLTSATETQLDVQFGEGERAGWYQLAISPLRDGRDRLLGSVALLHDVSQERALLRMRDDLTHMLVHDLRNPFSSIYSALQLIDVLLKEGVAEDDHAPGDGHGLPRSTALHSAIDIALHSSTRAQEMLDSLLDLNRLEGGQMPVKRAQVEAVEIARIVVNEMEPLARRRGLTLDLDMPASLPPGLADESLLDRVLRNLVGNSIKFTPQGGRVRLAARAEDSTLVLSVGDTGAGIPAHVLPRLFQKFVRGPGPVQGSGLGLAFCKLAVEAMGGRIWADSALGQGTTFHFTIPQAPAAMSAPGEAALSPLSTL